MKVRPSVKPMCDKCKVIKMRLSARHIYTRKILGGKKWQE